MSAENDKPRVFRRSHGQLEARLRPVILEYEPRPEKRAKTEIGSKGERYSAGLEDIQQAEVDLLSVMRRATRAVAQGVETYDRERARSAEAKTDGAIEDFPHNSAKALSEMLKEASEIPVDIADAVTTKNYRRRLRRNLQSVSKTLRVFRF